MRVFVCDSGVCAAISVDGSDSIPLNEQAEVTMRTNFFGTLEMTRKLLPLLQRADSSIIVNMASLLGGLHIFDSNQTHAHRFTDPALTLEELEATCKEFVSDCSRGQMIEEGWPSCEYPYYSMSKVAVVAMTIALARDYPDIMVNCCSPG
jgi:carbonyl reductase 1